MPKTYDVIIWGATGFTGRLVAEYLLQQYGTNGQVKWAMAARNADKLAQVQRDLGATEVPTLIADSHDRASLDAMAAQAKVVCTTVGPYALHGSELVAACIDQGTHYCDLTGEVQWMRRMIEQHHGQAQVRKLKIVHTCGYDSIPSDMGVFFMQQEAQKRLGTYLQRIRFRLKGSKGGFSGGTIASLNNVQAEAQKDPAIWDILGDPYSLNPPGERNGPDGPDVMRAEYDPVAKRYTAPFIMGTINTRVVRRSHALKGYPYGRDFQYDEAVLMGKGLKGKLMAQAMAGGINLVRSAGPGTLLGNVASWFLPKSGEGPSQEARESGYFVIDLWGEAVDGQVYQARVKGDRDPGYGATSRMLTESALSLAFDDLPETYGVLTPSVAMGDHLLNRLEARAGLSFEWKEG